MAEFSSADPNAYVGLAMQTAQGTPATAQAKFRFAKYISGMQAAPDITVVDMREGGDGLDWGFTYKQRNMVRGTLVVNARSEIAGQVLAAALGGATWDGGSAPAEHRFHGNHASFPWMTMHMGHPGTDLITFMSDLRFTGLTIEGGPGGVPIRVTAPFIGVTFGASGPAVAPTYIAEEPFLYHVGPSYLLDGAADPSIESWRYDMALGIEELQAQSVNLDTVVIQNRDANVQAVRRYQSSTLWKKIAYCGGVAPSSGIATGALKTTNQVPGAAGAAIRLMELNAPLLTYRGNQLTELDPDGRTVRETITAKALRGASGAIFVTLRNAHASAYGP